MSLEPLFSPSWSLTCVLGQRREQHDQAIHGHHPRDIAVVGIQITSGRQPVTAEFIAMETAIIQSPQKQFLTTPSAGLEAVSHAAPKPPAFSVDWLTRPAPLWLLNRTLSRPPIRRYKNEVALRRFMCPLAKPVRVELDGRFVAICLVRIPSKRWLGMFAI